MKCSSDEMFKCRNNFISFTYIFFTRFIHRERDTQFVLLLSFVIVNLNDYIFNK